MIRSSIWRTCAILVSIHALCACTGTNFGDDSPASRNSKKQPSSNGPTTTEKQKTTPPSTTETQNKGSDSQSVNNHSQSQNNGGSTIGSNSTPLPTPTPDPKNSLPPTVASPSLLPAADATLAFNAIVFTNMEYEKHATDDGQIVILRDAESKQVIAAGDLTLLSAVNGSPVNAAGAYPVSRLSVNLSVMSEDAPTSGQGLLSICGVDAASRQAKTYRCTDHQANGSAERPINWFDKKVAYRRSNKIVSVDNNAGGNGEDVHFGLSFSHVTTMGAIGGSVRQFADAASPLVLDLNRNGRLDLSNARDKNFRVNFDLDATGEKTKVGWVKPSDALLALDINNNHQIDDGSELFGEFSFSLKAVDKWSFRNFKDGFAALAQYDSNGDGMISKEDKIFAKLCIWQDKNMNGISEKGELTSLEDAKIASISLTSTATGHAFSFPRVEDNEVRYTGTYRTTDGKTAEIADIWFSRNRATTAISH